MHQDTLNHTILLSFLGQCHQSLIWIIVIGFQHTLHPSRCFGLHIIVDAISQETLDINTANSHVNHTNLDILGQRLHHRTTEPVGRSQTRIGTTERRDGFIPFTHLTGRKFIGSGIVHSRHPQESWSRTLQILSLRFSGTLHV